MGRKPSLREIEVLALICEGLTNAEIARRLHLSPHTVKSHVKSLLALTGERNRAGLVVWALRNHYVR